MWHHPPVLLPLELASTLMAAIGLSLASVAGLAWFLSWVGRTAATYERPELCGNVACRLLRL